MQKLQSVDIFCKVVDNFGDIGVCWRLARQLASQWRLDVRLWVDDLSSFRWLCPKLDLAAPVQVQCGIEIRCWGAEIPAVVPHDLVIEAFACELPETFISSMAARPSKPRWINLEYLSAEDWVIGCHRVASPHPRLPLTKYFFFPGFVAGTGGLLCEQAVPDARRQFQSDQAAQAEFWLKLQGAKPLPDEIRVSLFAYENKAVAGLLDAMAAAPGPVMCLVPLSRVTSSVQQWLNLDRLEPGDRLQRGALTIQILPFLSQPDYDRLLWACDINFVRGEDSLVRALWAARPCIWHIYPQDDAAHLVKLEALFSLYSGELAPAAGNALHALWLGWNHQAEVSEAWVEVCRNRAALNRRAAEFAGQMEGLGDLAGNLLQFCKEIS